MRSSTSVSTSSALLLDLDTMLRFLPIDDFNGLPGALEVYGLDGLSSLLAEPTAFGSLVNFRENDQVV